MRLTALAFVAALAASVVACSSEAGGSGANGANGQGGAGAGATGGAGTCDSACAYYLRCKGADASNQGACVQACQGQGYSSEQLAQFQQLDCATAVQTIEAPAQQQQQPKKSADCTNCYHDGTSCIWLSPSTGLHSACDPSCC